MKVVIYAEQYKGAERINNSRTYPRELRFSYLFAYLGTYTKSVDPKQNWFLTCPLSVVRPLSVTEDVAEKTVNFFKENFEEFNHPFIAIFDADSYPVTLEEFSKMTGVPIDKLKNS